MGSKARQHWLWYGYNTKNGGVLVYTFGPRTDETCRVRIFMNGDHPITPISFMVIRTGNFWRYWLPLLSVCLQAMTGGSYGREIPKNKHLTGKIFTERIERNNLTLRTRIKRLARKTICISRSVELHEKVIGAFIEKCIFN